MAQPIQIKSVEDGLLEGIWFEATIWVSVVGEKAFDSNIFIPTLALQLERRKVTDDSR